MQVEWWKFETVSRYFNHFMMEQFVAMLCIGRGVWWPQTTATTARSDNGAARLGSIEELSELRASVGVQWMLFQQCMSAARQAIDMLRTLQRLVGTVERVTELLELLQQVSSTAHEDNLANFEDDDCIAFEGVDVVTPGGVVLVRDLSFELRPGESLLLVGHNGAGKSSIFRCLGGLWPIPKGRIKKPGGQALDHRTVFYIPQKPCVCPL
jgi:ABC-type uncharacterized transport system fused permease/ATPase subunit